MAIPWGPRNATVCCESRRDTSATELQLLTPILWNTCSEYLPNGAGGWWEEHDISMHMRTAAGACMLSAGLVIASGGGAVAVADADSGTSTESGSATKTSTGTASPSHGPIATIADSMRKAVTNSLHGTVQTVTGTLASIPEAWPVGEQHPRISKDDFWRYADGVRQYLASHLGYGVRPLRGGHGVSAFGGDGASACGGDGSGACGRHGLRDRPGGSSSPSDRGRDGSRACSPGGSVDTIGTRRRLDTR